MTTVRRVDAPLAHSWTETSSGPKHDPACTCAKSADTNADGANDASPLDRALANKAKRDAVEATAGTPLGAAFRKP